MDNDSYTHRLVSWEHGLTGLLVSFLPWHGCQASRLVLVLLITRVFRMIRLAMRFGRTSHLFLRILKFVLRHVWVVFLYMARFFMTRQPSPKRLAFCRISRIGVYSRKNLNGTSSTSLSEVLSSGRSARHSHTTLSALVLDLAPGRCVGVAFHRRISLVNFLLFLFFSLVVTRATTCFLFDGFAHCQSRVEARFWGCITGKETTLRRAGGCGRCRDNTNDVRVAIDMSTVRCEKT